MPESYREIGFPSLVLWGSIVEKDVGIVVAEHCGKLALSCKLKFS